jgi:hypothetical protein
MIKMGINERGRITGMPGTETTVMLYPQRLGVRMRNSVIRMLENRVLEGGWSSKSRQLAQALAEKYGLQLGSNNWNGVRLTGITIDAAPLVAEIARADFAAWTLENGGYGKYYKDRHVEDIRNINNLEQNFFITLHEKESIRKVIAILAEHTTPNLKEKGMYVANLLRGTEPIRIINFRS